MLPLLRQRLLRLRMLRLHQRLLRLRLLRPRLQLRRSRCAERRRSLRLPCSRRVVERLRSIPLVLPMKAARTVTFGVTFNEKPIHKERRQSDTATLDSPDVQFDKVELRACSARWLRPRS